MKTCAIVGINWGDEGKGRVVDLLTADYDIVIRYQGGGNRAGGTAPGGPEIRIHKAGNRSVLF